GDGRGVPAGEALCVPERAGEGFSPSFLGTPSGRRLLPQTGASRPPIRGGGLRNVLVAMVAVSRKPRYPHHVQRVLVRTVLVLVALAGAGSAGGAIAATKPKPKPKPPTPPPARLWLGFQDDSSFRWGTSRDAMLDRAMRAGATVFRTNVYWS